MEYLLNKKYNNSEKYCMSLYLLRIVFQVCDYTVLELGNNPELNLELGLWKVGKYYSLYHHIIHRIIQLGEKWSKPKNIVVYISSCRQQEGWGQLADNSEESDVEGDLE